MKYNAVEDDVAIHEISLKAAYENKYDGITRCLVPYFWRNPPGWSGKLTRLRDAQPFKEMPTGWIMVSMTERPVTCIGCLGADPWL